MIYSYLVNHLMTPQASDPSMNFNISKLVHRYWHYIDIGYYLALFSQRDP